MGSLLHVLKVSASLSIDLQGSLADGGSLTGVRVAPPDCAQTSPNKLRARLDPNKNLMTIKEAGKRNSQAQGRETDDEAAGALGDAAIEQARKISADQARGDRPEIHNVVEKVKRQRIGADPYEQHRPASPLPHVDDLMHQRQHDRGVAGRDQHE